VKKNLGLALRLIRGAGPRDIVRTILMTVGIALSVAALMVGLSIPRALSAAATREAAREPVWGDPGTGTTAMIVHSSGTAVGDVVWTQVQIEGGNENSALPPGLTELPAEGHSVVSPALARLLAAEPSRALPLGVVEANSRIGTQGLTGPDEFLSYTRIRPSALGGGTADAGPGRVIVGYGGSASPGTGSPALGLEAMFLIAAPALLFLTLCSRLSLASRQARLASLRLIGVSRKRCAELFSTELVVVTAVACIAGLLLYAGSETQLSHGALGITWFPSDTRVGWPVGLVVTVVFCALTGFVARRAMSRALHTEDESPESRRHGGFTLWAGLACMLLGGSFLGAVVWMTASRTRSAPVLSTAVHVPLVMAATLALMLGLLLATPSGTPRLGLWLSKRGVPTSLRLGARIASGRPAIGRHLMSALVATLMVMGLSTAFLRSTYLDAVGDPSQVGLSVDLSHSTAEERATLGRQLPDDSEVFVIGFLEGDRKKPVYIRVTSCTHYLRSYELEATGCTDQPARAAEDESSDAVPAGASIRVEQLGSEAITVTAPSAILRAPGYMDLVIPHKDAPWATENPDALVSLSVPIHEVLATQSVLQRAAPSAVIQQVTKDPESLARYREQSAVLGSSLALAYLLCLLTFVFSMVEARWLSERALVSQWVLGVPGRITRMSNVAQLCLIVATGVVLVVPEVVLSGVSFLDFWGSQNALDLSLWRPTAILAVASLVVTAGFGWLLGGASRDVTLLDDQ
jgi:hypothetical protein